MSCRDNTVRTGPAFTLVELLVVIAVIALLIGLLLPVLGSARSLALHLKCKANLRSVGQAHGVYANDFADNKPPLLWKTALSVTGEWVSPNTKVDDQPIGQGILAAEGYVAYEVLLCPAEHLSASHAEFIDSWNNGPQGGSAYDYYWREPTPALTLKNIGQGATYENARAASDWALTMDLNAEQGHSYIGPYQGRPWPSHPRQGVVNVLFLDGSVGQGPSDQVLLRWPADLPGKLAWFDRASALWGG